jgi:hypothetical protein
MMVTDEKQLILQVVERFVQTGVAQDEQFKVICLPENKTSFVERNGEEGGRSVMLDEFRVGARVVWAAFSAPSQTVYLSTVSGK